ncbi:MAG: LPXTG cell wall anchor domain-containing protein, partial [Lachnospiraceae bacterium]|nr:LPXTG cell wall anchor domain-containing protein [Lachnospiraceae bacterium]
WAAEKLFRAQHSVSDYYDDVDNTAYNDASTALNSANATVSGLEGQESALLGEISNLNQTLADQNAKKSAAESELNAARSAQQSLEAQIQAAYAATDSEAAKKALKAALDEVIKSYAVEINQTQYDKELNDYVNEVWNGWNWDSFKFISKAQLRAELDKHYDNYYDDFWQNLGDDIKDIANIAGISQWLVNKDEVDDLIDQCVALSTAAIIEQYKKQAVIDATYAKYNAEDTLDDATTKDKDEKHADITVIEEEGVAKASAIIDGSLKSMDDAITDYKSAKSTYNTAKSAYEETLAALENCSVSGVNLEALKAAVVAAQQKLALAKASLETAEEQASVAANYANWAEALTGTNRATASTGEKPVVAESGYVLRASLVRAMVAAVPVADDVDVTSNDVAEGNTAYTEFGDVQIPYALFRQFVQENYEALFGEAGQIVEYNTEKASNTVYMWRVVDGVATELLKVVFDANGNPVSVNGEAVSSLNGTFFVASKLSSLGDSEYDLNGETVEIDYTAPVNVDPTPVSNVTTTASAASTGTVLGVTRESVLVDDMEDEEPAVLGADRPQTGDASQAGTWAGVMGAAATALAGMYLATKKRKDEEEA